MGTTNKKGRMRPFLDTLQHTTLVVSDNGLDVGKGLDGLAGRRTLEAVDDPPAFQVVGG